MTASRNAKVNLCTLKILMIIDLKIHEDWSSDIGEDSNKKLLGSVQ